MMPHEPVRDMMLRTMENYEFIKRHRSSAGPYEVTQLVNSFLAAMAHPWEEFKPAFNSITLDEAAADGWPKLKRERDNDRLPANLGDLLRQVRNAFAHGNIEFLTTGSNEITHLRFWNVNPDSGRRTWGTNVSVEQLEQFLERFVEEAEVLCGKQVAAREQRRLA